MLIDVIILFLF